MVPGTAAATVGVARRSMTPGGRVPEQIDHARLADARRQPQGLLQQDLHARADAGKALGRGKEGCELRGAAW